MPPSLADVTPSGVYESAIENPNRRFFTMLGTLVQGRVCVGGAGRASQTAIVMRWYAHPRGLWRARV